MIEIVLVVILVTIPLIYRGNINTKTFIDEEKGLFLFLKEKDYDFM